MRQVSAAVRLRSVPQGNVKFRRGSHLGKGLVFRRLPSLPRSRVPLLDRSRRCARSRVPLRSLCHALAARHLALRGVDACPVGTTALCAASSSLLPSRRKLARCTKHARFRDCPPDLSITRPHTRAYRHRRPIVSAQHAVLSWHAQPGHLGKIRIKAIGIGTSDCSCSSQTGDCMLSLRRSVNDFVGLQR
ncbi:hypothetical protein SAMN05216525_11116 [Bradyrhizobium sp. Gha]|nr:hypothetical protein SAMN05216525_11116 [Bradyrhizobium sp. Gha]